MKGYITYPRTENTDFPSEYLDESLKVLKKLRENGASNVKTYAK